MYKIVNLFFMVAFFSLLSAPAHEEVDPGTGQPVVYIQSLLSAQQQLPILFRSKVIDLFKQPVFRGALYDRPSRWYTFTWADISDQPSFAPELHARLEAEGWGFDNAHSFDRKSALARSPIQLLHEHQMVFSPLAKQYKLSFLGTNRHTIVMRLAEFPEYVIKVLRNKWALPFQSISRVLWAHSIHQAIAKHPDCATHICAPNLYLLHREGLQTFRPSQARTALNDTNYVIVEKYIADIPSTKENKKRFKQIAVAAALAVITIIKEVGIWDVADTTLLLVPVKKGKKIVRQQVLFSHLECPGRGGYTSADFYQRQPETTDRLAQVGLQGLVKMLPDRVLQDDRVIAALGTEMIVAELERRQA